jgi:tetratricopeptide (TPR) repeat protein
MGALFADLGDAETAIDFYERSLGADPDQSVTWVNAGLALETLGDLEQAASAYETATGIYRWEALAHMNLGNLRLAAADPEAAVDRYRVAIEADPGLVQALYYLALAQVQLDRRDEAMQALRSALALSPDHAEARSLLDRLILEGSDSP